MTPTKKVILNTLAQIGTKAITVCLGIIIRKLLAVYLGPAGLGEYFFILTFVTLFGSLADMGTVLTTVREAAKDKNNAHVLFGNVFWLRIALSGIAIVSAWTVVLLLPLSSVPQNLKNLTLFGTLLIFVFSTKASLSIVFQTLLKMEQWAVPEITASLGTLVFTIIAIQNQKGLFEIVGSLMTANIVATIIALVIAQRLTKINFHPQKKTLSFLVANALPMGGVLVVFSIYNKLDMVLLQSLKGSQTVGIYGVAYAVYDVLVLGAAYFMNAVLPILSEALNETSDEDKKRAHRIFQKSFAVLFILAVVIFIFAQILAPLIIAVIASPEFINSTRALRFLLFAVFIAYLNHLTGYTLVALNKQKTFFLITLAALVLNVAANLILIPPLAEVGSAVATILTEGVVFALTTSLIFRSKNWLPSVRAIPEIILDVVRNRGKIFRE